MAKILIESKPVVVSGSLFRHLYLVFVDDDGNEFVIRGGPEFDLPPFGLIVTEDATPLTNSEDARQGATPADRGSRELDLGGRDAVEVWNIMRQQIRNIQFSNIDYDAFDQNSNSTIASVLNAVGLPLILPFNTHISDFPAVENRLAIDATLVGSDSRDVMAGWTENDTLYGLAGDDDLIGERGNDQLYGGPGNDYYYFLPGDGQDIVVDEDGQGTIFRSSQTLAPGTAIGVNQWVAKGTIYTRSGADLQITFADDVTDKITIKDFDFTLANDGYLGIQLIGTPTTPVITGSDFNDRLIITHNPNAAFTYARRTKGVRLGILHKSAGPARWRNFPSFSNVVPELRSHDSV